MGGVIEGLLRKWKTGLVKDDEPAVPADVPAEERVLVGKLLKLREVAGRERDVQTSPWQTSFEYYMGKQLEPMANWKADIVANEVRSRVETLLALCNQQRPRPEFTPEEEGLDDYADHMQALFEEEWEREEMDGKKAETDKTTFIFGNGFYFMRWCDFEKEIKVSSELPQRMWLNPGARRIKDARYLIHERRMSLSELLVEYPEAMGKVTSGSTMVRYDDRYLKETSPDTPDNTVPNYAYRLDSNLQADTTTVVEYMKVETGLPGPDDEEVQVFEFWLRDYRAVHLKERDLESGETQWTQRLLYPGGRHIVMANHRIILDEANPYKHASFPYIEQHCYRVPGRFWSVGVPVDLVSPQDEINKTLGHFIDNRNLMGNNQFKYTKKSGLDPNKITAEPGIGIPVTEMSDFERIAAPPLPSYISELFHDLQSLSERISNVPAVAQGVNNAQLSGVAIEAALAQVNVANGFMIDNIDITMKELARQWLANLQQYQQSSRRVAIQDPETMQTKVIVLTPEQIQKNWGIRIGIGSSIPMNRESRIKFAFEMVKLQLIDRQTALEEIRMPLARRALKRMRIQEEQQHKMALQIEMAKAMAGGAGGGGSPPGGSPAGPVDAQGGPVQSGPGGMGVM